mgnify:CR=1 FL=1
MSYYVIGIGGTGARCIEAFVHLCAAGLMPQGKLNLYFVDADETNGNLVFAKDMISKYTGFLEGIHRSGSVLGSASLFQTEIHTHEVWSPFKRYQASVTLEDVFSYSSMDEDPQDLFELLYTNKKRKMKFQNGFLGWPSVGSSVIAKEYKSFDELISKISHDNSAKVILIGSIFGGTGAAGIPTLAKLIKDSFHGGNRNTPNQGEGIKRTLGLILMLPYFNFQALEGEEDPNANPTNFKLKTKMALEYYHNQKLHDICDAIYTLSDDFTLKTSDSTVKGGQEQKNNPHFLELYAGLFALDFFINNERFQDNSYNKYFEAGRTLKEQIGWSDLPYPGGRDELIDKLGRMIYFSFAYCTKFFPRIKQCFELDHAQASRTVGWYGEFFSKHPDNKAFFSDLRAYCLMFLKWLEVMQKSAKGQVDINLVRDNYLMPPDPKGFGNLLHDVKNTYSSVDAFENEFMKVRKRDFPDAQGDVGKFINALYKHSLKIN